MTRSWLFIAATPLLFVTWLTMLLGGAGPLDRAAYEAIYARHSAALLAAARLLTLFGEPTLLIAASAALAIWLWIIGRPRTGLALLAVTLSGRGLSELQKYWIARPRPALEPHLVIVKSYSFPSGHAMSSMIFYLTLALLLAGQVRWRRGAAAAAIAVSLLIGTSRVMLGVHWPSDVIAGWACGLLWVLLALKPVERLLRANSEMDQTRL